VSAQARRVRSTSAARSLGQKQGACVQLGGREQLELDRGHDTEASAAAAEGPEEIWLVLAVGAHEPALGGDELDGGDAVRREAPVAGEPAEPAAERVADDADIRRGAVQDDEALLGRRSDQLGPDDPRPDAGAPSRGVDRDAAQARRLDEDRIVEGAQGGRAVPGSLRRDAEAAGTGEADDLDDVVGRVDERDRERALVDGEVQGLPGLVQARVRGCG
jgi:hypothetical protein